MNICNKELYEMKKAIDAGKAAQATQALPFILEDLTNQIAVQNEILQYKLIKRTGMTKEVRYLLLLQY